MLAATCISPCKRFSHWEVLFTSVSRLIVNLNNFCPILGFISVFILVLQYCWNENSCGWACYYQHVLWRIWTWPGHRPNKAALTLVKEKKWQFHKSSVSIYLLVFIFSDLSWILFHHLSMNFIFFIP